MTKQLSQQQSETANALSISYAVLVADKKAQYKAGGECASKGWVRGDSASINGCLLA
ncbi:hypothetical protein RT717_13380 [Imperialibacter roseus]|uniref:Uncharacterized protein n=1 Tax=Imperialibacter roseus TaxID=1324217 RepID=A0ABZ0IX51_9BACT|nr:hypothetical protein [Imperialibacter roseus]WOK09632.1 hypothetical protein RT717_13380 [Imperialibacter roseus]